MFKLKPPKTRTEFLVCACINLLATPGLGTIIGGRPKVGILQLGVATTGFVLLFYWFAQKMRVLYDQFGAGTLPLDLGNSAGIVGLVFFGAAWLWALVSTIGFYKALPERTSSNLPPRIFY